MASGSDVKVTVTIEPEDARKLAEEVFELRERLKEAEDRAASWEALDAEAQIGADEVSRQLRDLKAELADVRAQWASDVGSAIARAQTAEARVTALERDLNAARAQVELEQARAERAEEKWFHVTMETYRTGLVGDAFRFMRYWRDRSCKQSEAARKVARYTAQATASMDAMEEQVKDARAEAARLRELIKDAADGAGYAVTFGNMLVKGETIDNCGDPDAVSYLLGEAKAIEDKLRAALRESNDGN